MVRADSKKAGVLDTNNWVQFEQDGYQIRTLGAFKKFRGLEIPWDEPERLELATERVVKASRSRKVVKLSAGQYGQPVEVYVKRYNIRTLIRLIMRAGRKTRAGEEFDIGWKLMEKGVKTPRPVWLAESKGAISRFSLLATEALPEAESVLERWQRCEHEGEKMALLISLGQFVGRLHDIGFYHDDFKAGHVLLLPDKPALAKEFYVIDLLGGAFPPVLTRLSRAKSLYQMIRSFVPKRKHFGFTEEHRTTFLEAYAGSPREAQEWSGWVERVGALKGRQV